MKYNELFKRLENQVKVVQNRGVLPNSQRQIYLGFDEPFDYGSSHLYGIIVLFDENTNEIKCLNVKVVNHLSFVKHLETDRQFMGCPVLHITASDEQSFNVEDVVVLCSL